MSLLCEKEKVSERGYMLGYQNLDVAVNEKGE